MVNSYIKIYRVKFDINVFSNINAEKEISQWDKEYLFVWTTTLSHYLL